MKAHYFSMSLRQIGLRLNIVMKTRILYFAKITKYYSTIIGLIPNMNIDNELTVYVLSAEIKFTFDFLS